MYLCIYFILYVTTDNERNRETEPRERKNKPKEKKKSKEKKKKEKKPKEDENSSDSPTGKLLEAALNEIEKMKHEFVVLKRKREGKMHRL